MLKIKYLYLDNNDIREVSEHIQAWKELLVLNLSGNFNLKGKLHEKIGNLTAL